MQRKTPPSGLSAEVKERIRAVRIRNTARQEQEMQGLLMQKLQAVWKFQKEQHEWLQLKLNEIYHESQLETPIFPNWVFESTEEEDIEIEEEVAVEKERRTKRKGEPKKNKKGNKQRVEEEPEIQSEEETEEDEEAREAVKNIDKDIEEDDSESMEESEEEEEEGATMEELARKKYELKKKSTTQPPIHQSSTHKSPTPPPKSPTPPPQPQPTSSPAKSPQTEEPTQVTRETTPAPIQSPQQQTSPTIPEPTVDSTNPIIEKENLQVIQEESEEEMVNSEEETQGEPKQRATGVPTPEAGASKKVSKVMATSPATTMSVVLKALAEKKEKLGYTTKVIDPQPHKKAWTMSSLYGVQELGQAGAKETIQKENPKGKGVEAEKEVEKQAEPIVQQPEQTSVQSGVPASGVPAQATSEIPTQAAPESAEMPEASVEDPGVPTTAVTTKPKPRKVKA